ncbi:hypothetical protein R1flu_027873 [Riccia fluitans]|uniref:Uncharacterized protein n=1 Tax=Riccia fluitans TaxID=41844 RepID=A0ABD1XK70_9MARC
MEFNRRRLEPGEDEHSNEERNNRPISEESGAGVDWISEDAENEIKSPTKEIDQLLADLAHLGGIVTWRYGARRNCATSANVDNGRIDGRTIGSLAEIRVKRVSVLLKLDDLAPGPRRARVTGGGAIWAVMYSLSSTNRISVERSTSSHKRIARVILHVINKSGISPVCINIVGVYLLLYGVFSSLRYFDIL